MINLLGSKSWTPHHMSCINPGCLIYSVPKADSLPAFGTKFDYFKLFVVDILHEVELGVMKSLFADLVRILYAIQQSQVQELDIRYLSVLKVYCPVLVFDILQITCLQ